MVAGPGTGFEGGRCVDTSQDAPQAGLPEGGRTPRTLLAASGLPRLEVQMLLADILGCSRVWLITHDDEHLPDAALARFRQAASRRRDGVPMAYLLGVREFMGHDFQVTPDVLIPRPDTELLVEQALSEIRRVGPAAHVLDMGTGSGAIAVSLALAMPDVQVAACDASAAALVVARGNAQRLGARVSFFESDWFAALPQKARYDLIVSNPPYIAVGDPHLEQGDLRHEPRMALTDDADGLENIRIIVAGAPARLNPGGALWLEHGWDQAAAVRGLLVAAGFQRVNSHADLAGIARISGGYL